MNIIINCTSLGFDKNKQTPIDKKKIKLVKDNAYFFDAIYNPLETNFLKLAKLKSKNCPPAIPRCPDDSDNF